MAELQTYIFPAIQAFFLLIVAIAWLAGFIRQRNFGFLLLTIVFLAEGVATGIRQAIINYVIYHEPGLPVSERASYVGLIGWFFVGIFIVLWLLTALGAFLIAFHHPKPRLGQVVPPPPPVS